MNKKVLMSILIIITFLSTLNFFYFNSPFFMKNRLKNLSSLEKEYLENFFQYIIRISSFGYVLFGDKPMSIDAYDPVTPLENIEGIDYMDDYHILGKYRFKEGWKTWKKYQHLFPSSNFVFFSYPHPQIPDYIEICLINKMAFIKTVQENLKDFHQVLGKNISSHEVLNSYLNQDDIFLIIRNHDGLLGTLLGYGRGNAWAFAQFVDSKDTDFDIFDDENPEEMKFALLPGFRAFTNTKETKDLKFKYLKQREILEKIYSKQDFTIPTLNKLSK